jgi:hypothetical protein
MSHLDFLSHTDRFLQSWVASNNSTSKFCSLPMLQNWGTCERGQLIPLRVCAKHCKAENSPKTLVILFCTKIDEFCMILCRVPLNGWVWRSISSSSQLGFAQYFFSHHSYRCLLSTLECFTINKARYLGAIPPKTCNSESYPKLQKL